MEVVDQHQVEVTAAVSRMFSIGLPALLGPAVRRGVDGSTARSFRAKPTFVVLGSRTGDSCSGCGPGATSTGVADDERDELAARRVERHLKEILRVAACRTPEQQARSIMEVTALDYAYLALEEGRSAFESGDLGQAEYRLRVAAGFHAGDGVVYLAAFYRLCGHEAQAGAWTVIAEADGFAAEDVDAMVAEARTG